MATFAAFVKAVETAARFLLATSSTSFRFAVSVDAEAWREAFTLPQSVTPNGGCTPSFVRQGDNSEGSFLIDAGWEPPRR